MKLWRKCVGVEPTERRFPDAPQALKARRITGPYSLPPRYYKEEMATKYEILKKRRVNRAKKKARLKRKAQTHFATRKGQAT